MQKQMNNVSEEMEILRKNQEKVLEIKSAVTKKKNAFNGLINGLDMTQERVSELEYVTIETSKTEKRLEGKPPQNKTRKKHFNLSGTGRDMVPDAFSPLEHWFTW